MEVRGVFEQDPADICLPIEFDFFGSFLRLAELEVNFYTIVPPGIPLVGGFSIGLFVNSILTGDLCLKQQKLTMGPEMTLIGSLTAFVAGEIPKLFRAGFELAFDVISFTVILRAAVALRGGPRVGFRISMVFFNPYMVISAFVDAINLEWCGDVIPYPCGFSWKRHLQFVFWEGPAIPGTTMGESIEETILEVGSLKDERRRPLTERVLMRSTSTCEGVIEWG